MLELQDCWTTKLETIHRGLQLLRRTVYML